LNLGEEKGIPDREDLAVTPIGEYFARLPRPDRDALRRLSVLHWFDRPLYEFWMRNANLQLEFVRAIELPVIRPLSRVSQRGKFVILPSLREQLAAGLREERNDEYITLHRLAADYFHRPLTDIDLTNVSDVVDELGYLTTADTDQALLRFAEFAHAALLAGWAEAASRAARVMKIVGSEPSGGANLFPVARLVIALAALLARAGNERQSAAALSGIIADIPRSRNRDQSALVALRFSQQA
jgi:hypothetical protein